MSRLLRRFLTSTAIVAFSFATPTIVHAQSPQSRDALIRSVQKKAVDDAESEAVKASVQDLNILFGKQAEAAGLTMQEVTQTYDESYREAQQQKPWWTNLKPNFGWIVAIIFFFILILQEAFRKTVADAVEGVLKKIYRRAAGYKFFQQKALRHYKRALINKYQHFKIPFRAERDLDMTKIYIPLKIKGKNETDLINDLEIMQRFRRIVVLGAPGSGKSMLLKRIALSNAFKNIKTDKVIPVIIDLRRFNEGDKSVFDHLVAIMELNDFPNAGAYIEASLTAGTLLLLFDGLDEVANIRQGNEPTKRETTVRKIIDLLDTYENCPAIITCRTAVYRRDFDEIAERTLEIVEFSDQQIQNFLMSWPDPPPDKPIEQLIASLSERPAILALARNPLLLTIVAFLYTDMADFVLPYSRTEFYTQAVDVLLQQLKGGFNRYRLAPKLLVLCRLALFNQEKNSTVADRLTIEEPTVLRLINELLPSLSLESKDVTPLLEEIVQRSNLLLEVDNKTKYQFFHLTLQEFFAASALRDDGTKLLDNFRANKDAWRETVKLWCGLPHDSTKLIQEVFKIDPLTAFECLADAPMVDQATADEIIDYYKPLLGTQGEHNEAITKAFSGVAAGRSQRGGAVLTFLMKVLNTSTVPEVRKAAADALALSNKEEAVICLTMRYDSDPEIVRPAIIKMGNLAVTSLKRLADNGQISAINALYSIGTSKGVDALVPLLWHRDEYIQTIAALKLAQIVGQRNGLELLRDQALSAQQIAQPWYDWVWAPFTKSSSSTIPIIIGRIAFLLDNLEEMPIDKVEADWKIVVPLVIKEREKEKVDLYRSFNSLSRQRLTKIVNQYMPERSAGDAHVDLLSKETGYMKDYYTERLFETLATSLTPSNQQLSTRLFLNDLGSPGKLSFLVGLMDLRSQFRFLGCLLNSSQPRVNHWQYIMRTKKPLINFWPYTLMLLVVFLLSLISLTELITRLGAFQSSESWRAVVYTYLAASIFGGWFTIWRGWWGIGDERFGSYHLVFAAGSFIYPMLLICELAVRTTKKTALFKFGEHLQGAWSAGFGIALTLFSTFYLLRIFSIKTISIIWLTVSVFIIISSLLTNRHISRYDNPLRKFALKLQREPQWTR